MSGADTPTFPYIDPADSSIELDNVLEIDDDTEVVIQDVVVNRTFAPILHKKRKANSSPVWLFIQRVNTPAKNRSEKMCDHACNICVNNERQWKDCLINIHNANASNGATHLNTHHADNKEWIAARKLKDDISSISTVSTKRAFNAVDRSLSVGRSTRSTTML